MIYLSGNDLVDLSSPIALVAALEEGLGDYAERRVAVPVRQHVEFGGSTLLSMPAVSDRAFGAKIVSIVPSNATCGLPVINGLMTLFDGKRGLPLAVLDAGMLTAQRTGAVGAIGIKYTTPPQVDCIGIIGTGVQGTWQTIFACAVRPIRTVYYVARSGAKADRFAEAVSRHVPSVRLARCADAHELLTKAQIVITATTSSDPVLPDEPELLTGKHFVGIGSFKPSMKELPASVYELAPQAVVDSDAAKSEAGELLEPLSSRSVREEDVVHIADLVSGKRSVSLDSTTVFKSVGMALYDLYAAHSFFNEAQRSGRGTRLNT